MDEPVSIELARTYYYASMNLKLQALRFGVNYTANPAADPESLYMAALRFGEIARTTGFVPEPTLAVMDVCPIDS